MLEGFGPSYDSMVISSSREKVIVMIHELMDSLIIFVIENSRLKCICDIAIKRILFNDKVINQQRKMKILKR